MDKEVTGMFGELSNESSTNSPLQDRSASFMSGIVVLGAVVTGQPGVVLLQIYIGDVPQVLSVSVFPASSFMLQAPPPAQATEPSLFVALGLSNRLQVLLELPVKGAHDDLQASALPFTLLTVHAEAEVSGSAV